MADDVAQGQGPMIHVDPTTGILMADAQATIAGMTDVAQGQGPTIHVDHTKGILMADAQAKTAGMRDVAQGHGRRIRIDPTERILMTDDQATNRRGMIVIIQGGIETMIETESGRPTGIDATSAWTTRVSIEKSTALLIP